MVLRGLVKCLRIFFIIFLMCPKRSRLSAPLGKQQEYYQAIRKSLNEVNDGDSIKLLPTPWSTDIIKEKEDVSLMGVDTEPGFDLCDDEIRKFKLWPKGIIPYYIDTLSFGDKVLRDRIRWYLNEVNTLTKISFIEMPTPPKDSKHRWVFFINRQGQLGCADHSISNFTNEGVQRVVLGYDCMTIGGELAETVLSIAGVPPQHNSPDRDKYIKVIGENISPGNLSLSVRGRCKKQRNLERWLDLMIRPLYQGLTLVGSNESPFISYIGDKQFDYFFHQKRYLFDKLNSDQWLFYDIKYDFSSAGHFHYHKHSRNGRATIEALPPYSGISMGESNGFSSSDIKKLRMLYNYIVNKKENKVPECDKLFRKGHNFHKKITSSIPQPKPRKKPHQYLGIPEKESIEHHEEKKVKINDNDEKDHSEDESSDEQDVSNMKSNLKTSPNMEARYANLKKDPLSYLSDYLTGDERRRVGRNK